MTYIGELISIGVAFSWTATALLSEFGSKRLGNLTLNVLRMALALVFSLMMFMVVSGSPFPAGATPEAMGWMLLSGLVGYVIGDFCLFQCYIIIGSRYGQLFMTLAPLAAALMAWITSASVGLGSACHVHHLVGYQHLCSWPRRASQGVAQVAAQRRTICHRCRYVPRYRTGT